MSELHTDLNLILPENKEFEGKVVLISGGSSGIGLATAQLFSNEKAHVCIVDIGKKPSFLPEQNFKKVDISNWRLFEKAVNSFVKEFGGFDVVVNNAAVKIPGSILEVTSSDFERLLRINGLGFWNVAKGVLPYLIKSHGTLINVCSGTSPSLPPNTDAYFGSKGVTYSLTHALSSSFGNQVRIVGIAPGPVDTPLWRTGQSDEKVQAALEGRAGPKVREPNDIARMIVSLASPKNGAFDGSIFTYM